MAQDNIYNIQWFPGHMAKTRRLMQESLSDVDSVIEIRDARIPFSSKNPEIDRLTAGKPRLVLFNKASLCDRVGYEPFPSYPSSPDIHMRGKEIKDGFAPNRTDR